MDGMTKDGIVALLRENLSINLEGDTDIQYGMDTRMIKVIRVSMSYDGEEICRSRDVTLD